MRQRDWIAFVSAYSKLVTPTCENCFHIEYDLALCKIIRERDKINPIEKSCHCWEFNDNLVPRTERKRMNTSISNGLSVSCGNGKVIINGEEIPVPKGMRLNSQVIISGKIYIGGYEYFPEEKAFRKTLKASMHRYS